MKITIKNMVCHHCANAVRKAIVAAGLTPEHIELGMAELREPVTSDELNTLDRLLEAEGFSRVLDAETAIVENVKRAIIHHVREENGYDHNLSGCVENSVGVSYDTASRIFSGKEGRTIEKYYIAQKIEWVKELIRYGELTLSEISYRTGYSSVSHLSRQFKMVTGMTPTEYVKSSSPRKGLNEV
ncbi:MAG: AraC family transcriptional regulator [Duncaniella sp.]|nr:AraC family transcriptional regulator [Duncaniella sp.]